MESNLPKTLLSEKLNIYRGKFYYKETKKEKDWELKIQIEECLRSFPSYGSRRISIHLKINRKRVKRVMNLFGIKAYRRRGRKWKKTKNIKVIYPNLLLSSYPTKANDIWVTDFTYIKFQGKVIYVATVMDIFTRKIIGLHMSTNHQVQLVLGALFSAINNNPRPIIFHSDNGSEYNSEIFVQALLKLGIKISRSAPGCPWENGYQESFYSQFKVDLGDPARFVTLGELVYEIYQTIYTYNNSRIHSALKMSPQEFILKNCEKEKLALHY
jgi:transposase InsO family protein